jgi:hypothetical protein
VTRNGKPHLPRFEREKRAIKNQVNQQELEFINQDNQIHAYTATELKKAK